MDQAYPFSDLPQFLEKAKPIVEQCLEIIEKSGITAADAEAIPAELYEAIVEHNKIRKGREAFKRATSDLE